MTRQKLFFVIVCMCLGLSSFWTSPVYAESRGNSASIPKAGAQVELTVINRTGGKIILFIKGDKDYVLGIPGGPGVPRGSIKIEPARYKIVIMAWKCEPFSVTKVMVIKKTTKLTYYCNKLQ